MIKILLINPGAEDRIKSEVPALVENDVGRFPPLGLLYLAASLGEGNIKSTQILDLDVARDPYAILEQRLAGFRPDVVGISIMTHLLPGAVKIGNIVKQRMPETHVVAGGPHATIFPEETLSLGFADSLIAGEADEIFPELVGYIYSGRLTSISKIKGVMTANWEKKTVLEKLPAPANLDSLKIPDRRLLDTSKYFSALGKHRIMTTAVSSRGCPYRCSFCSTPRGVFRMRSAENVASEIEECRSLGIREVHFVDDVFNITAQRAEEVAEAISRKDTGVEWSFRGRINGTTEEMLRACKRAGCTRIHFGVETATEMGLQRLNKEIDIERAPEVFSDCRKFGIETVAYFMIGCPHEKDRKEIKKTIKFAKQLKSDYVLFGILTPYPGTPLYEEARERGMVSGDVWREFALKPDKDFLPPVWDEFFSREELGKCLNSAYKKFYLSPGSILRGILNLGSFTEFVRKVKSFFKILKL